MLLRRKIYDKLLEWKNQRKKDRIKKCLLIKGARQVGKSYIVQEFGKSEYASFINIDFYRQPDLKGIFDGEMTAEEVMKRLTAYMPGVTLIPGGRNGRESVEVPASVPVGYESQIMMYSLDFEEFLWAYGYDEKATDVLRSYYETGETIPEAVHIKYENLFREFMVVGGMPEVVADFSVHKDFNRVDRIQNDILAEYRDDIAKHAKGKEKQLVRMCYDAVPKQLAKELKKFQYSTVEKGQTRRKFGGSIQWLKDSGIVNACYNIREPYLPLMANANEDQFKLYINDTGLLCCMYGKETKLAVLNNTIKGNARGGIYENSISECLLKRGYTLYYYKPDNEHEVEFLIEEKGEVVPVEVKAGNNASPSLNNFIKEFSPSVAFKLIGGRNGKDGAKETLPHYMVMFL